MQSRFHLLFILSALVFSCSKPRETQNPEEEILQAPIEEGQPKVEIEESHSSKSTVGDNSQTSLDWAGTYFNTLPCEHCEGVETWVTLHTDGTFELKTNYLGLNDAREEIFTGNFKWDEKGSMVQLEGLIGDYPGKFKVGENQIWHLDKEGNRIDGALADRYILKKK